MWKKAERLSKILPMSLNEFLRIRQANHHLWVARRRFPYRIDPDRKGRVDATKTLSTHKGGWALRRSDDRLPTYVVNLPLVISGDREADFAKWRRILTALRDRSFERGGSSRRRLVVLIGVNRYFSIDPDKNSAFRSVLADLPLVDGITYKVRGLLWKPTYHKRVASRRLYAMGRAFRLFKALEPEKAARLLKEERTLIGSLIPFQSLRDWRKEDPQTHQLLRKLVRLGRMIYWVTMDDDFRRLGKLLSQWDRLIKNESPTLLSTGYWAYRREHFHRFAFEIDNRIRCAMIRAGVLPYLPEPACALLYPGHNLFRRVHYRGGKASDEAMESRHFTKSALDVGAADVATTCFRAVPALITTLPERMRPQSAQTADVTTLSGLFSKKTLRALRLSQSHLCKRVWGLQAAWSIAERKGARFECWRSPCGELLGVFLPDTLSAIFGQHSAKKFGAVLDHHKEFRSALMHCLKDPKLDVDAELKKVAPKFDGICSWLKSEEMIRRMGGIVADGRRAQRDLKELKVPTEVIEKIRLAARFSGAAFGKALLSAKVKLVEAERVAAAAI